MPTINIRSTVIEFPDSSASPNWAEAVIQFAEAVQDAIALAVGPYDVPPTVLNIDSFNPTVAPQDVTGALFPVTAVRAFEMNYSVYRATNLSKITEQGSIQAEYNPDRATNEKWQVTRQRTGDASITFSVTDAGQVQFETATLAGTGHVGALTIAIKALLQSN